VEKPIFGAKKNFNGQTIRLIDFLKAFKDSSFSFGSMFELMKALIEKLNWYFNEKGFHNVEMSHIQLIKKCGHLSESCELKRLPTATDVFKNFVSFPR
jgi:hypothetical protein